MPNVCVNHGKAIRNMSLRKENEMLRIKNCLSLCFWVCLIQVCAFQLSFVFEYYVSGSLSVTQAQRCYSELPENSQLSEGAARIGD